MASRSAGQVIIICLGGIPGCRLWSLALAWAAFAKTDRIVVGTGVTAPILRHKPAVVVQVFATLGYMFPGRIFLGLGRSESLNEVPAGTI